MLWDGRHRAAGIIVTIEIVMTAYHLDHSISLGS